MPKYDEGGYGPNAKGTSKNPLSEFGASPDYEKLNIEGASFDGLDDMGVDAEAGKSLREFSGLRGTTKNSSITSHGKAKIPSGGSSDPADKKY